MKTVHIVFNAHLDPVWLWSWRDGLDEVLNSSYYICNLLDRHPDIHYTRGEAWLYEQIQKIDPALFERILAHVLAGRWHIVGGWYLQPDCNLPSGFAMERQIALGKEFFQREFGQFPEVAYNVDSFGHAAALPGYMRAAGQSSYVMMRPGQDELKLPARLFRWRGYADGPEVTTFRLVTYCTPEGMNVNYVRDTLRDLPEGITHTMCFAGVGDHGGGPSEEIIEWCRAHRQIEPDIRLEFSTPSRFFQAIAPQAAALPLFVGELQQNAIGCYSVHRAVKTGVRRAEHLLRQAELAGAPVSELAPAWKRVCFNHFHDTLGGTCLPSAYEAVHAELGAAFATADEAATLALRRRVVQLPEHQAQRLVYFNASEHTFDDFLEVEPWLEWTAWQPTWSLSDENGSPLALQILTAETGFPSQVRLLFPLRIRPGETRILSIVEDGNHAAGQAPVVSTGIDFARSELQLGGDHFPIPRLVLMDDPSDTWSHGLDRYLRIQAEEAEWEAPQILEQGELLTVHGQAGRIGSSRLRAEWRIYAGRPWIELRLDVLWQERHRLLKLEWEHPAGIAHREDGVMGGSLERASDGRELPFRDWTHLHPATASPSLSVVSPDVFAMDGDARRIGLTLLRSSAMACHAPNPGTDPRTVFSDHGPHTFRLRFLAGNATPEALDELALNLSRPPLHAEVTRGMKNRAHRAAYRPGIL